MMNGSMHSRRARFSRKKMKPLWKRTLIVVLSLVILLIVTNRIYVKIQGPLWAGEKLAIERVNEEFDELKIHHIERAASDQLLHVVYATDEDDVEWYIWVDEENMIARKTSDGVTIDKVKEQFYVRYPEARIARILLSKWQSELVWEIYAKHDVDEQTISLYEFYRFSDGKLLETFQLQ